MTNWHLSGTRAGGRSSGSPGPREEAGPGRDIGLWAPVLLLLLLLCWCLEEEGVPAAPSPFPYNLANSDPEAENFQYFITCDIIKSLQQYPENKLLRSASPLCLYLEQHIIDRYIFNKNGYIPSHPRKSHQPMKAASKSQGPKR